MLKLAAEGQWDPASSAMTLTQEPNIVQRSHIFASTHFMLSRVLNLLLFLLVPDVPDHDVYL